MFKCIFGQNQAKDFSKMYGEGSHNGVHIGQNVDFCRSKFRFEKNKF